jgi:hypothetical protein
MTGYSEVGADPSDKPMLDHRLHDRRLSNQQLIGRVDKSSPRPRPTRGRKPICGDPGLAGFVARTAGSRRRPSLALPWR